VLTADGYLLFTVDCLDARYSLLDAGLIHCKKRDTRNLVIDDIKRAGNDMTTWGDAIEQPYRNARPDIFSFLYFMYYSIFCVTRE